MPPDAGHEYGNEAAKSAARWWTEIVDPLKKIFGNKAFAPYLTVNFLAYSGAWAQRLALGWFIWRATHSGFWLATLSMCDLATAVLFGPLGGVLSDRTSPPTVIFWAQLVVTVNAVALAALAVAGTPSVSLILALAILGAGATALSDAARTAVIWHVVPPDLVPSAVATTSVSVNLARFMGPAIAGVLLQIAPVFMTFAAAAALGLPLALSPLLLGMKKIKSIDGEARAPHWLADLVAGVRYAATHSSISAQFLLFFSVSLLIRPTYELMPALADGLFHKGAAGLAILTALVGIGAVAAGLDLTRPRPSTVLAQSSFRAGALSALCAAALAATPWFVFAACMAAVLGFCVSTASTGPLIVAQMESSAEMRARVISLWALIVRAGPALGTLLVGTIADRFGFRAPFLAAAGLCLGAVAAIRLYAQASAKRDLAERERSHAA